MKLKNILPLVALVLASTWLNAQIFMGKTCEIKIFTEYRQMNYFFAQRYRTETVGKAIQ